MTPETRVVARAMIANYCWMIGGFCLIFWSLALPRYKDQLLPFLYVAVICGIIFAYILHQLSEGRGIVGALVLILLALVGHIAVQSSFMYGFVVVLTFFDKLPPVPVWPLFIAVPISLICAARLKRAAEEEYEPVFPVTRRREIVDLDCPCEDGKIISAQREALARLEGKCRQLESDLARTKSLEAQQRNRAELEDVEEILTLPGVRERLRSLVHPDRHDPAEQRKYSAAFQKLSAFYKRRSRR
jgi:hypothetical protein